MFEMMHSNSNSTRSFFNLVEIRPSTNNACLLIVVAGLFFWEDVDRGVERDPHRGAAVPCGRDSG
jgi:hypothetical protein